MKEENRSYQRPWLFLTIMCACASLLTACPDGDKDPWSDTDVGADVGADTGTSADSGVTTDTGSVTDVDTPDYDKRVCEHELAELAAVPNPGTLALHVLTESTLITALESTRFSWLVWNDQVTLDFGQAPDLTADHFATAVTDNGLLVAALSGGSLSITEIDAGGIPTTRQSAFSLALDVLWGFDVLPASDGLAVVRLSHDSLATLSTSYLHLYLLDADLNVLQGPIEVWREERTEDSEVSLATAVSLVPLGADVLAVLDRGGIFDPAEERSSVRISLDGSGALWAPTLFELRSLQGHDVDGQGYLTGLLDNDEGVVIYVDALDSAGEPTGAPVTVAHGDGRAAVGEIHLEADGDSLLASYLAGHENNYVFHVLQFDPTTGAVQSDGVVAFSGGAFRGNQAAPASDVTGDYLYAFGRNITNDSNSFRLLRGTCDIDY